jgi:hypothetical protein
MTHTIFAYRTPLQKEFNILPVRAVGICRFPIQLPSYVCSITRCFASKMHKRNARMFKVLLLKNNISELINPRYKKRNFDLQYLPNPES